MQATQNADAPVVIPEGDVEALRTADAVEAAHGRNWRLLHARHGRMLPRKRALAYASAGKEVLAGPDPLPDDPDAVETETYYHVTQELNTDDILEDGLDVSVAENAPTGDGVYVAPTRVDAENWAHVLCAEEGWVWFDVLRVEVPKCLPVLPDERIRSEIKWKYPDSNVLPTAYGVPPRFIAVDEEAFKADASLSPN